MLYLQQKSYTMPNNEYFIDSIRDAKHAKIHFAVMAIGAAADRLGITSSEMYERLNKVGIVQGLLFDLYEVEHTQSLQHVAEDVVEALKNWENPK